MEKFVKLTSTAIPLEIENVDTDQIIPARFLKATDKQGFGDNVFRDWRYNKDGSPNENFVLNSPKYSGSILVAGTNFGCGSSREHAAWALVGYGFKVIVLAGPQDRNVANDLVGNMKHTVINLCGKTSLGKLASLLKRCKLFISNDSGPVHIACAVETPVISIFGRNQKGLSPSRWAPLGKKDKVLHREVGCQECLAHNCLKQFACLKAISVEDVLGTADTILKEGYNDS